MKNEDSPSKKQIFLEKLSQLEQFTEEEQKQKIEEMNEIMDGMSEKEFDSVFTKELFNKLDKIIEEKKLSMGNAISLMKHIGSCKVLLNSWIFGLFNSLLYRRFEKMIIDEEQKKEGKNEKLLIDLCECYLLLSGIFFPELLSICMPCLLKVALKKEGNEETQKDVEIALLALSRVDNYFKMEPKLFLNEIKEIIQYHQEHQNLTRLAYQSAWQFLIKRFHRDKSLEGVVVNELHFVREAVRELDELSKSVDWKRKEERKKETEEALVIRRWLSVIFYFFASCKPRDGEFVGLLSSIVQIFLASRENSEVISCQCIDTLKKATEVRVAMVDDLLKSGAVDVALEIIVQLATSNELIHGSVEFFWSVCERLKNINEKKNFEAKREKVKRKIFEKLEEEGYEDCIIGLHYLKIINWLSFSFFMKNIEEYFICC